MYGLLVVVYKLCSCKPYTTVHNYTQLYTILKLITKVVTPHITITADRRTRCAYIIFIVLVAMFILLFLVFIGYWAGKTIKFHKTTKTHDILMSTTAIEDITKSQSSFFKAVYSNKVCLYPDPDQADQDVLKYVQLNLTFQDSDLEVASDTWNITIRNTWEGRRFFSFYWMSGTTVTLNLNNITINHDMNTTTNFTILLLDIPGEDIDKDIACNKQVGKSAAHPICTLNMHNKSHCHYEVGTKYHFCSCNYTVTESDAGTHYLCLSELEEPVVTNAVYEFTVHQNYYNVTSEDTKSCNLTNTIASSDTCCIDYGDIFTKLRRQPEIIVSTNLSQHNNEFAGFPLYLHIKTDIEEDVIHYLVGVTVLSVLVVMILTLCWCLTRRKHGNQQANCEFYCCFHLYQLQGQPRQ